MQWRNNDIICGAEQGRSKDLPLAFLRNSEYPYTPSFHKKSSAHTSYAIIILTERILLEKSLDFSIYIDNRAFFIYNLLTILSLLSEKKNEKIS